MLSLYSNSEMKDKKNKMSPNVYFKGNFGLPFFCDIFVVYDDSSVVVHQIIDSIQFINNFSSYRFLHKIM